MSRDWWRGSCGLLAQRGSFLAFKFGLERAAPSDHDADLPLTELQFGRLRLVIGNPLVMKEMAKHVPDAGSYAPVTVLVDERTDGVHLSYDRMASFLEPYENLDALKVARELDAKVEKLLNDAAAE